MDEGQSFRHVAPSAHPIPVIVEIPHAGTFLPAAYDGLADDHAVRRDADLFVDELYEGAHDLGAHVVAATYSRYYVDLNRAESDIDERSVEGALPLPGGPFSHGLIWSRTTRGEPALRAPISRAEFQARMATIYRPYHARVALLIDELVGRFGHVVLIAAHSMPNVPYRAGVPRSPSSQKDERADIVPGTRGRTTASGRLIASVESWAHDHSLSLRHDTPYAGGFTTAHYGAPEMRVHAIQIELNRRLYMDEQALSRSTTPGAANDLSPFARTKAICLDLVGRLGSARP